MITLDEKDRKMMDFLIYIGLGKFKSSFHEIITKPYDIVLYLENEYTLDHGKMEGVNNIINSIREDIKNSQMLQDYQSKDKEKIGILECDKKSLEEEVERLKQYESYYNMLYKITHGKEE